MGLFAKKPQATVATVEVSLFEGGQARVESWMDESGRQEHGYRAVLHFLMYYVRILFFLSYRDTASELVEWVSEAVNALAAASDGSPVDIAHGWKLVAEAPGEPFSVWSSTLTEIGHNDYRCTETRPKEPEDAHAQAAVLCHLQMLADTLPALERAYLAVAIAGVHEYHREIKTWASSLSMRPAVGYGMSCARRVLERG